MRTGNWRNLLLGAGLIALGVVSQSALVLADGMTKEDKWADRATDPPGTRQVYKYGKLWPPQARPTGREQSWKHKFHHAHYWPYPYNDMDRQIVRDTLAQQTSGGWVLATTLHDYHFNAETNELNSAGRSHLYWIMTSVPAQFRTVFVAHGLSPQVDEVRVATVDRSAREFGAGSASCDATLVPVGPSGRRSGYDSSTGTAVVAGAADLYDQPRLRGHGEQLRFDRDVHVELGAAVQVAWRSQVDRHAGAGDFESGRMVWSVVAKIRRVVPSSGRERPDVRFGGLSIGGRRERRGRESGRRELCG